MSLDTKYRPRGYGDVLGQETTKKILKSFVSSGKGFHQSYMLAGPFGSGKTTLGRILARALLCDAPIDGEPCDQCSTCKALLDGGTVETFTEVDAATNSGKEDILAITESLKYDSFSGKRRLFLFDESHRLSTSALDALLKPLEENLPNSSDKRLVCIFCTTEPEKMRDTILSRCAPAFIIQPLAPVDIAKRLEFVCEQEQIPYEEDALVTIAEITECHIRDALKAVEGVRMLGDVNVSNVSQYLHLDLNHLYVDVLGNIESDLPKAFDAAKKILERTPAASVYERLADYAMEAYHVHLGIPAKKSYLNLTNLAKLGNDLLGYAMRFGARPGQASAAMLLCDIGYLHNMGAFPTVAAAPQKKINDGNIEKRVIPTNQASVQSGVYIDPRAVKHADTKPTTESQPTELDIKAFCLLLGKELKAHGGYT